MLEGKKLIYHINRKIEETGALFGDEAHIIYINASVQNSAPLGRLMHDFHCTSADEMYYKVLADRVRYLKESKEGKQEMCEIMERLEKKAEARGRREGRKDGQKRINLLFRRLNEDGRMDDWVRSVSDRAFQKKLLSEYGL